MNIIKVAFFCCRTTVQSDSVRLDTSKAVSVPTFAAVHFVVPYQFRFVVGCMNGLQLIVSGLKTSVLDTLRHGGDSRVGE